MRGKNVSSVYKYLYLSICVTANECRMVVDLFLKLFINNIGIFLQGKIL